MWVFTTAGFVSAVQHRDNHDNLMVRARDKKSLEAMLASIELAGKALEEDGSDVKVDKDLKIVSSASADYRHRVVLSKATFALFLQFEVLNYLSYPNFKSELGKFRGPEFTRAAHNVWDDMLGVSDGVQLYGGVGVKGERLRKKPAGPAGGYHSFTGSSFGVKEEDGVEAEVEPGDEHGLFEQEYAYKDDEADAEVGVLPAGSDSWDDKEWEAWIEKHYGQPAVLEQDEPDIQYGLVPGGAGSEVAIPAKKTRRSRKRK